MGFITELRIEDTYPQYAAQYPKSWLILQKLRYFASSITLNVYLVIVHIKHITQKLNEILQNSIRCSFRSPRYQHPGTRDTANNLLKSNRM